MPTSHQSAIVLATGNPGKINEMKDLLEGIDAQVLSINDFDSPPVVIEDLPDLEGNALKKARAWFQATGKTSVADDTGLEVPFLGGAPGVYSARYAGEEGNAEANVKKLLVEMSKADGSDRRAQFRTVVAVVTKNGEELFHGICEGTIAREPSGDGGFGYDPVFVPDGFDESFASLSRETKNQISHRGKAVREAATFLRIKQTGDANI